MKPCTSNRRRFLGARGTALVSTAIGLTLMAGIGGCLASGGSTSRLKGAYVGSETFSQIEVGQTDTDWLHAVLGEPSSRATLDDGTQVWKWGWSRERESSGAVLFLFASKSKREEVGAVYVEIKDDIVVRKWRD